MFAGCDPQLWPAFRKYLRMARACGPVRVTAQKTRIVFQVRVRYGGAIVRKKYLWCSMALPERTEHPRFEKIETYGPHFHAHRFRVYSEKDLDAQVQRWLREAYKVGAQVYIRGRRESCRGRSV